MGTIIADLYWGAPAHRPTVGSGAEGYGLLRQLKSCTPRRESNVLVEAVRELIEKFARERDVSGDFVQTANDWYLEALTLITARHREVGRPILVGISGCQGSGKSTLADLLSVLLEKQAGCKVALLALDDFYLGREDRAVRARELHRLFATRGVPGTHDTAWMNRSINDLLTGTGAVVTPVFDKSKDDRTGSERWHHYGAPVDVVLLEGWCVGIPAQSDPDLASPCNELECSQDPEGEWRGHVNRFLATDYQPLFDRLDLLLVLQAPNFEAVAQWRFEQEQHLGRQQSKRGETTGRALMDEHQVKDFVQYFQRLTLHGFEVLPERADLAWQLSADRTVSGRLESAS